MLTSNHEEDDYDDDDDNDAGAEDDGGKQPEGQPAPADCGQDNPASGQGCRWSDRLQVRTTLIKYCFTIAIS